MPQVSATAIILHAFPYGDTSKIVRLVTGDFGVMSAVAKGAHRAKSRFGARIQPFSEGTALIYVRQNRDLQTLAEFDVEKQRAELAGNVERYLTAAALAEVVLRFSPEGPHREVFNVFRESLDWLVDVDSDALHAVSLVAMWSLVGALGFTPSMDVCSVDGRPVAEGTAEFSVADGGLLCPVCARARETATLAPQDRAALESFVAGVLPSERLPAFHAAAHRRLLTRFVRRHIAEGRQLPALEFWESGNS